MGDFLNLNLSDDLNISSIQEFDDTVSSDSWTTKLTDGGKYAARIEAIESKVTEKSIGYNVELRVAYDTESPNFSATGSYESLKFNYVWLGDNAGTESAPQLELRNGTPGKGFLAFVHACGGPARLATDGALNLQRSVGAVVEVKIKHEEYNGNLNARVAYWNPAPAFQHLAVEPKSDDPVQFSL